MYNTALDDLTLGEKGRDRAYSEETDEEFDWFNPVEHTNDTYSNSVNKNRKTI